MSTCLNACIHSTWQATFARKLTYPGKVASLWCLCACIAVLSKEKVYHGNMIAFMPAENAFPLYMSLDEGGV